MSRREPQYDLVYVVANEGWTFEGTCKDIDKYLKLNTHYHFGIKNIPPAKAYYFSHHAVYLSGILRNFHVLQGKTIVQYTHYSKPDWLSDSDVAFAFNKANKILTMNEKTRHDLIKTGVFAKKVETQFIGVDENIFYPQQKEVNKPTIGFNLRFAAREGYFGRKNYDKLVDIIKRVDFCDVVLLGRDWTDFDRFKEIQDLPYFKLVEASYREYPKYYRNMDVFVSVSRLEGGPIPLLEAMFCNVFPVVSRTGFATDLINNGENGLLFDVDASVDEIIEYIKIGLKQKKSVSESVEHLTWKRFASQIEEYIS
jgi:glycosyltransferase involved in cell wall biosynthesis